MRVFRIDATVAGDDVPYAPEYAHSEYVEDVAGMLTRFAIDYQECDAIQRMLTDAAWEFDVYEEEIGEPQDGQLQRLLALPWPVLDTIRLLDLAASPKVAARERLDEILRSKGKGLPVLKPSPHTSGGSVNATQEVP